MVVADSHIRSPDDETGTYPSNALMVARNEFVVDVCNRIEATLVVHLGDIVHPLQVEAHHEAAVELAAGVYARLGHPIYFVPGNHDIGDKPNSFVAVPPVADNFYHVFERHWGPAFRSLDVGDLHLVLVDTPVLNSGLERERLQRIWLEDDLTAATATDRRIFMFTHYPPFVRTPDENEHYDNLGEPARSWLLDLIAGHHVEAVFSGHVHNFAYNHHRGTEFYVLPSTGFVRPDYSELAAVPPESEGGRDDPPKLGFFVVDVSQKGHTIRPVRTNGATLASGGLPVPIETTLDPGWQSPVGVTLRHGWMPDVDFPAAGLDEFGRKTIRNDATLPALWEARIRHLRIPIADAIRHPERLRQLAGRGDRFTVVSAGVPNPTIAESVAGLDGVERWEIATPAGSFEALHNDITRLRLPEDLRIAVGPIVRFGSGGTAVHHFVATGFSAVDTALLDQWLMIDEESRARDLVFRMAYGEAAGSTVSDAGRLAAGRNRSAVVLIELPRAGEGTVFEDDMAVADVVAEAVAAAQATPDVTVFLDTFMDQDRGYYRRHGLIDRHHNPRPGLYRLIRQAAGGRSGA